MLEILTSRPLTNDIVSFEQPGPGMKLKPKLVIDLNILRLTYNNLDLKQFHSHSNVLKFFS